MLPKVGITNGIQWGLHPQLSFYRYNSIITTALIPIVSFETKKRVPRTRIVVIIEIISTCMNEKQAKV